MDMDPRILSLQTGAARAAEAQARLAAQWRPLDSPQLEAMRPDPVLQKLGHTGLTPRGASEDPSRRWLGQGMNRPVAGLAQATERLASFQPTDNLSEQVASSFVDVYLSVSASTDTAAGSYPACNQDHFTDCDLYRVRMNLVTGRATEVERVVAQSGGWGNIQPALSPSGRRLAYLRRSESKSALEAWDLETGATTQVVYGEKVDGVNSRPQFPNWYDENTLLFHSGEQDDCTLYKSQIDDAHDLHFGAAEALLGPRSDVSTTTSFADASTRRDAKDVGTSHSISPRRDPSVATFGSNPTSDGFETPRVHALAPASPTATAVRTQEFDLGENMEGNGINTCHHPAWNPSGNRILCTSQNPSEAYNNPKDNYLRFLYSYSETNGTWSDPNPVFIPFTPEELEDQFGPVFPRNGTPHCEIYTYKFAEWCASDDYIVATLFCSTQDENSGASASNDIIISSRVMLIRRFPVRYTDITGIVEASRGLSSGQTHGVYSTCKRVEEAR